MSMDASELAFKLRHEFDGLEDGSDVESFENRWGCYGDFQLVGNGEVGSYYCGKFQSFKGCLRVDLHNIITTDGKSFAGKVFVRKVRFSCGKPSCPVCYERFWAVREAGNIEGRLAEASKRFGLVEHIVVAVPPKFYGLSFVDLRKKAIEVLFARGVAGGAMIFHGFRYNVRQRWYWSPHFHVLGFILGGYGRCRGCEKCVKGCGGFVDRSYRCYETDGCIVKVLGKRKTVFGTAWYQLNHSSIKVNAKRFHVATWFGVCSYRKLKVTVEKHEDLCPICRHELINIRYFGDKHFVLDGDSPDYRRDSFEDCEEDGQPVWVERVKPRYGSGSYE